VLGAHQPDRVDDAEFGASAEEDENSRTDRQQDTAAQRVHHQRLKGDHAQQPACLVEQRPRRRVIRVERIVRGVGDEAGDDLRALDRDVPRRKRDVADAKSQRAAHGEGEEQLPAPRLDVPEDPDSA
jgi:hypothetical protein